MFKALTRDKVERLIEFAELMQQDSDVAWEGVGENHPEGGKSFSMADPKVFDAAGLDALSPGRSRLYGALSMLSASEMRELVALMLLGRGDDCECGDDTATVWADLCQSAKLDSNLRNTIGYLMGKGTLGVYLRAGLARLQHPILD